LRRQGYACVLVIVFFDLGDQACKCKANNRNQNKALHEIFIDST